MVGTETFSGGTGTKSDPYLISNVSDLTELATNVNGGTTYSSVYFRQTKNITLDSTWAGIGNSANSKYFWGYYDGHFKTVTMNQTTHGLFGFVMLGLVEKLIVKGEMSVAGTQRACGAIADYAGMAGNEHGGSEVTIKNCKSTTNITFNPVGYNTIGGIVGMSYDSVMENVVNEGSITAYGDDSETQSTVGGIVGKVAGNGGTKITNSYNSGKLDVGTIEIIGDSEGRVSGIVGYSTCGVTVENCYNTGSLTGVSTQILQSRNSATCTNCYGLDSQTSSYDDGCTIKSVDDLKTQTTFTNWDFDTVWTFVEGENDGYPVLQAFYNNLTCSVNFDATTNGVTNSLGGSTTATTVTVDEGGSFALNGQTATCSKSGWSFVGWSLKANSTDTITGIDAVNESTTLYAVYECTVALTFYQIYDDTATLVSSKLYNNETNKTGTAPAITVPTGYTEVGWGTTKTSTTRALSSSASVTLTETTNGQNYYAICKKNVTLTYDANDGTGRTFSDGGITYKTADGTTSGYTTKAEMKLKECSFTRDKYAFVKWQLLGVYCNVGLLVTKDKDCTAYAVWEKTVIDLTFNVNFGNYATAKANMILYLLCDDGNDGYTELSTFYFDGKQMTQKSTVELSRGTEYKLLICKPYTWNLTVSGTGVSNATLVNCAYTFTTSGESGTITINTTGGTLINNYVII